MIPYNFILYLLQYLHKFNEEYKAVCSLLQRSNLPNLYSGFNGGCCRGLHTSPVQYKDEKENVSFNQNKLFCALYLWNSP